MDGLRRFEDATVVRRLRRSGGRSEPLGFGIGEVAALATPVVWLVLDEVAQKMVAGSVDRASHGVKGMVRRLLRRPARAAVIPPLTRDQLTEVRALVVAAGAQRGLAAEQAEELADAVVVQLALHRELDGLTPPPPEPPADQDGAGSDTGQS
ncbi:hypothetical protein [Streptomyces sp. NPDC047939]|uniref:hypothetical protein n=1 Tax=Streptomyces sp. NPDC047939 TaxID=3155381 RepID=UPI0034463F1C